MKLKSLVKKETKICRTCGLIFSNRAKWSKREVWSEVVYCSEKCRRKRSK